MLVNVATRGRISSSTTRQTLHSALNIFGVTSYSAMSSPAPLSLSTDTIHPKPLDFNGVFDPQNRSRTISILTADRECSTFSFDSYGNKDVRKAAVLVPFCYDLEGRPGILCNLRSEKLSSHSGEISFPGGTMDPEDNNDPIATALRETEEELGIPSDDIEIWTACRVFPTVSTRMGVVPVVGFIRSGPVDPERLEINPDEVDHAFVVPLQHLCDPKNWKEMSPAARLASLVVPVFGNMHQVSEGLQRIPLWGLTAFVTHLVLQALIPQEYTRRIKFIKLNTTCKNKKQENVRREDTAAKTPIKPQSKL